MSHDILLLEVVLILNLVAWQPFTNGVHYLQLAALCMRASAQRQTMSQLDI